MSYYDAPCIPWGFWMHFVRTVTMDLDFLVLAYATDKCSPPAVIRFSIRDACPGPKVRRPVRAAYHHAVGRQHCVTAPRGVAVASWVWPRCMRRGGLQRPRCAYGTRAEKADGAFGPARCDPAAPVRRRRD